MPIATAPRRAFPYTARLAAAPATVFPLFCPKREYDWIPGWSCDLVHAPSGLAEDGGLFRTAAPHGRGAMTWVIARHEPPSALDFTCFAEGLVMRLRIRVSQAGTGSSVNWMREYTALDEAAASWLSSVSDAEVEVRTALLFERLTHYVRTGAMVPA